MDYVYMQWDAYDVIEHGRANLDSRRTPVERQILSVQLMVSYFYEWIMLSG
jgi:hypothetical protein